MDRIRRQDLTRLVLNNHLTEEECDFIKACVQFHETGKVPTSTVEPGMIYAEKILCALGKKIPAIKSYRDRNPEVGLVEAKAIIDSHCTTEEYKRNVDSYGWRNVK